MPLTPEENERFRRIVEDLKTAPIVIQIGAPGAAAKAAAQLEETRRRAAQTPLGIAAAKARAACDRMAVSG